jgi:hypothetical protein
MENKCKGCAYAELITKDYQKDSISCGECRDRHDRDSDKSNYKKKTEQAVTESEGCNY